MISALRICSRALCRLVLVAFLAASLPAVTVTGKIELRDSKDPTVRKKMDFSGVVVWLEPLKGKAVPPPAVHARMIQKSKTFTPHILAVPVGATVDFPNFDPIFHNVFSTYDGQIFDLGLYPPGRYKS